MVRKTAQRKPPSEACGGIHEVAFKGRLGRVKKLLDCGADPNARDEAGKTPLHYAAMAGYRDVAELLLDYGADPNARDFAEQTLLHRAVARGNADVEELLLERGADPNARDADSNTPLHIATMAKYFGDVSEVMFEAAPKLLGPAGFPYDRTDVVRLLLEYGADPTAENYYGMTPLDLAIKMNNDEAAEIIATKMPPEYKKRLLERRTRS